MLIIYTFAQNNNFILEIDIIEINFLNIIKSDVDQK